MSQHGPNFVQQIDKKKEDPPPLAARRTDIQLASTIKGVPLPPNTHMPANLVGVPLEQGIKDGVVAVGEGQPDTDDPLDTALLGSKDPLDCCIVARFEGGALLLGNQARKAVRQSGTNFWYEAIQGYTKYDCDYIYATLYTDGLRSQVNNILTRGATQFTLYSPMTNTNCTSLGMYRDTGLIGGWADVYWTQLVGDPFTLEGKEPTAPFVPIPVLQG